MPPRGRDEWVPQLWAVRGYEVYGWIREVLYAFMGVPGFTRSRCHADEDGWIPWKPSALVCSRLFTKIAWIAEGFARAIELSANFCTIPKASQFD